MFHYQAINKDAVGEKEQQKLKRWTEIYEREKWHIGTGREYLQSELFVPDRIECRRLDTCSADIFCWQGTPVNRND